MSDFTPTHLVTLSTGESYPVQLCCNNCAYSQAEWETTSGADVEVCEGDWLFQGEAGVVVSVRPIVRISPDAVVGYYHEDGQGLVRIEGDVNVSRGADQGNALRDIRLRAGETQTEVARRGGISQQCVSNWELGRRSPRFSEIDVLAAAYGVTVSEIRYALAKESAVIVSGKSIVIP